ncbi:hypothetical protein ACM55O_22270, partial [Hafnia paralvei]|uniref:hypothetical protein n=1 Tax=Hafnia paralvei TaxID=546367 RepID=UPI0039FD667E
ITIILKDYRLRILTNPQTPLWKSFSQLIQMRLFTQPLDPSGGLRKTTGLVAGFTRRSAWLMHQQKNPTGQTGQT